MKLWIAGKKIDFGGAKIRETTLNIDGNRLRVYPLMGEAQFEITPGRRRRSIGGQVKLTLTFGIAGIRRARKK